MSAYARLIVRHSYAVLALVTVVSLVCTVLPLALHALPTFTDPIVGFETRGTMLAHRFLAWKNLDDETHPSRRLAANPKDIEDQLRMNRTYNRTLSRTSTHNRTSTHRKRKPKKHRRKPPKNKHFQPKLHQWAEEILRNKNWSSEHEHWGYGKNVTYEDDAGEYEKSIIRKQWVSLKRLDPIPTLPEDKGTSYCCGSPMVDYAHLVVTSTDGSSLLSYENILNICELQTVLVEFGLESYNRLCQRPPAREHGACCPQWSMPNYIAVLANKSSCHQIKPEDIDRTISLMQQCAPYFHNLNLTPSCSEFEHCRAPKHCSQFDAVYNILFYLVDVEVFSPENSTRRHVASSMIFLPLARSSTILPYYMDLQKFNMTYKSLIVSAMDFGLKNSLFDLLIIRDTWLVGLGGFFVLLCVWMYTGSLILTLMVFVAIAYSLGISYFFYTYVFNLNFFPFMNLLVVVIVIGIGADDAFLYIKVWKLVKSQLLSHEENNFTHFNNLLSSGETLVIEIVNETLKHSILTMLVTTLTTSVAFFASFISYIPAINCFSVFAGTAVLVNFILMILWLPATVFILDTKMCLRKNTKWEIVTKPIKHTLEETRIILRRFVIFTVQRLHIVIIVILGGLGICSSITVFYYPGLRLPDSEHFQLFQSSHPFEQYELNFKDKFIFERFQDWGIGTKMPLYWIWGIKAIDNGNHMDPSSKGLLEFDDSFNISDPDSQVWLLKFCTRLKSQSFYQPTLGPLLPNCFIESLIEWMGRRCIDSIDNIDRSPCCESSTFPYNKDIFDFCIIKAVESLYRTPREFFMPGMAGPKFSRDANPPGVAALVVEFESTVPYSMSYSSMNNFFIQVENWTQFELKSAPPGMKSGWFISELHFYDLQGTLASGTVIALILSACLGFLVLLPATLSFVVSLCAVIAMAFSVTVTISILVLIGWKLNILESVAISTSAGLAVDFNLHYALSYSNSCGTRSNRVVSALNSSVGPTAAAALTTGFAGIFLLYSNILPYSQIGLFLALIMAVSWSYSTWFLCSLLYVFGCNNSKDPLADDRRSMSRVSSICSGVPNLESHELEHFADSNRTTVTHPHSPSSFSATTVVLHGELESLDPKREETN